MKTPMQELLTAIRLKKYVETNEQAWEAYDYVVDIAKSLLEKEKEVMIDFAYKFGDEPLLEIAKWYDKQFNTEEK